MTYYKAKYSSIVGLPIMRSNDGKNDHLAIAITPTLTKDEADAIADVIVAHLNGPSPLSPDTQITVAHLFDAWVVAQHMGDFLNPVAVKGFARMAYAAGYTEPASRTAKTLSPEKVGS